MFPAALRQQMTGQVIRVKPLHDDDDHAVFFVVETTRERLVKPCVRGCPICFRKRLPRIQRVIDDQEISTIAGSGTAYRSGETLTALGRNELPFLVLVAGEMYAREYPAIPLGLHD